MCRLGAKCHYALHGYTWCLQSKGVLLCQAKVLPLSGSLSNNAYFVACSGGRTGSTEPAKSHFNQRAMRYRESVRPFRLEEFEDRKLGWCYLTQIAHLRNQRLGLGAQCYPGEPRLGAWSKQGTHRQGMGLCGERLCRGRVD